MSRPTFRIWDKWTGTWYEPTYRAYAGELDELLLLPNGDLLRRTVNGAEHESIFEGRYEVVLQQTQED